MRKGLFPSLVLSIASAALTASCAGDGTKLLDIEEPQGPFPPRLSAIHRHLLGPACSPGCHEPGGIAPFSMTTAADAYASLVGVPNTEGAVDARGRVFLRVNPGKPGSSYIILKLEGAPVIVGDRMPLGLPPLDQATIDAVAEWIALGAPND